MSPRGEQFSGILLATHVPRLWPYCLSVRDERAIYPRGHCHDQKKKKKKGNPACLCFSRAQPEKLNFTSIRETNWRGEKIWKETKMDEVATTDVKRCCETRHASKAVKRQRWQQRKRYLEALPIFSLLVTIEERTKKWESLSRSPWQGPWVRRGHESSSCSNTDTGRERCRPATSSA